jgi:phage I-like protein
MISRATLSNLTSAAGALPTEFLIFRAGENPSTKGVFVFDEKAAASVLSTYQAQGVDLCLDLEHQSLGEATRPDSADARGWFKLELRGGDLWAVDLKLTPDGTRRLTERTVRYVSPAFTADEAGHIVELINVALVAMPALHGTPALVAASKVKRGLAPPAVLGNTVVRSPQGQRLSKTMNPELLKKILAAIEAGEDKSGLLAEIVSQAAGGTAEPAADVAASDALSDTAADDPKPDALASLMSRLSRLEAEKAESVKKLSARVAELEAEREAEDQAERVKLCGALVVLGREDPATAWEGDPEKLKPAPHLQAEPIASLRARVKVLSARGPIGNAAPLPSQEVDFTPSELEAMAKMNDAQKAKFKVIRASRRAK